MYTLSWDGLAESEETYGRSTECGSRGGSADFCVFSLFFHSRQVAAMPVGLFLRDLSWEHHLAPFSFWMRNSLRTKLLTRLSHFRLSHMEFIPSYMLIRRLKIKNRLRFRKLPSDHRFRNSISLYLRNRFFAKVSLRKSSV